MSQPLTPTRRRSGASKTIAHAPSNNCQPISLKYITDMAIIKAIPINPSMGRFRDVDDDRDGPGTRIQVRERTVPEPFLNAFPTARRTPRLTGPRPTNIIPETVRPVAPVE